MVGGTYARAQEAGYKGRQLGFIVDLARDTREEAVQEIKRYLISKEADENSRREERATKIWAGVVIVFAIAAIFYFGFSVGTHFPIN